MASIKLNGDTSGTVTVTVPAVAGTNTATIPAFTGTVAMSTDSSGALAAPFGTTAQRPASPASGYFRYNTTTTAFEGYGASGWGPVGGREILLADRTYYVATTGSDSNNGLSAGSPFLTINKAVAAAASLDCSIYNVTIQVADGTYTGNINLRPLLGSGTFIVQGNTTTPANVVISVTSLNALNAVDCGTWTVRGFKFTTATSGVGVNASGASKITLNSFEVGSVAGGQHILAVNGAVVFINGTSYKISGASTFTHMQSSDYGIIFLYSTSVTITGSPSFGYFAYCNELGLLSSGSSTFTGTVTGTRYLVQLNAVINTNGGGANYFPGNVAGSTATGGQYA